MAGNFFITLNSNKCKENEKKNVQIANYLESKQSELTTLKQYIIAKIKKKILKGFTFFDIAENGQISTLKYLLVLRNALDKSGYSEVSDIALVKVVASIGKDGNVTKELATDKKIIYPISELLKNPQYDSRDLGVNKIRAVVEFVNDNFALYDYLNEHGINQSCVLLVFSRFCQGDLFSVYHTFEKQWNSFKYSSYSTLSKDELINFILSYLTSTTEKPPTLGQAPYRRSFNRKRNIKIQTKEEPDENAQTVHNLSNRLAKLEAVINTPKPLTPASNVRNSTLADEIIKDAIIKNTRRRNKSPYEKCFFRGFPHKCTSEYCLLCRKGILN